MGRILRQSHADVTVNPAATPTRPKLAASLGALNGLARNRRNHP